MSTTYYSIPDYIKNIDMQTSVTTSAGSTGITSTDTITYNNWNYTIWPTRMVNNGYITTTGTNSITLNNIHVGQLRNKSSQWFTNVYRKFVGQIFLITDHMEKRSFYLTKERILDYLFMIGPDTPGDYGPDFSLTVRHPTTMEETQYSILCSESELLTYYNSRMNESNSNKVHEPSRA